MSLIDPAALDPSRILAAISDASDDAIVVTDVAGVISTWNRSAEVIYGYSPEEVIGRSIGDLISDEHKGEPAGLLGKIRAGDRVEPQDLLHVVKDGQRIEVLMAASPIRDDSGAIVGAAVTIRDMGGQRRAERGLQNSDARNDAIIKTAVDAIIVIDRQARIEDFNPAAERLFGYRTAEVVGRNVSILMPEPFASEHDHYLRRYQMTGQRRIIGIGREVPCLRRDGTTFPGHLSVAELTVNGEVKFTGVIRDLTDRVRLETKLREESGLVRLGELAAVLAHEIKNPLAAVSGAIQVLSSRLPSPDDREIVGEVLRRIEGLSTMVGDLLLYARPPKPRLAQMDIGELVEHLVTFLKHAPEWRAVNIRITGTAPAVMADADLLRLALQNLLVNAVQAMDMRGDVSVRLHQADELIHIDVSDVGPGIPADLQPKLFTPFFTTKSRGTGLGLATVRRIADAHQGRVEILSSDSRGTTVRFSVPRNGLPSPKLV